MQVPDDPLEVYALVYLFLGAEVLWKLGLLRWSDVDIYLSQLPPSIRHRLLERKRCSVNWRTDFASLELQKQLLEKHPKLDAAALFLIVMGQVVLPSGEMLRELRFELGKVSAEEFLHDFQVSYPEKNLPCPNASGQEP